MNFYQLAFISNSFVIFTLNLLLKVPIFGQPHIYSLALSVSNILISWKHLTPQVLFFYLQSVPLVYLLNVLFGAFLYKYLPVKS